MIISQTKNTEAAIWDMARELANSTIDGYTEDLFARQYIYYTPSENPEEVYHKTGDVCIATNMPTPYILADNQHLPRNKTADQLTTHIHKILRSLPII